MKELWMSFKAMWMRSNWVIRIVLVLAIIYVITSMIGAISEKEVWTIISVVAFVLGLFVGFVVTGIVENHKDKKERLATNHKTTLGMDRIVVNLITGSIIIIGFALVIGTPILLDRRQEKKDREFALEHYEEIKKHPEELESLVKLIDSLKNDHSGYWAKKWDKKYPGWDSK